MKKLQLTFVILFLFSIKCSAQYFEGVITYKMIHIPETRFTYLYGDTLFLYTIKGDKVRLEAAGDFFDKYYIYSNTKLGEIIYQTIDTIQKYYDIVISEKDTMSSYYFYKYPKEYKSKKRKDKKILGYNCKYYRYVNNRYSFDFWITDSIIPNLNGPGVCIKNRGIILESHFESDRYKLIQKVVAIHPKPISPELFKIPADCEPRKSNLPEAMRKYKVDEKLIPRDSLRQEKSSLEKKDLGKWGDD